MLQLDMHLFVEHKVCGSTEEGNYYGVSCVSCSTPHSHSTPLVHVFFFFVCQRSARPQGLRCAHQSPSIGEESGSLFSLFSPYPCSFYNSHSFSSFPFFFLSLIHFSPTSFTLKLNKQDHTTDRIEETRRRHKQQGIQSGKDTTYQTSQAWTSFHHISHCRSSVDSHSTHSCLHSWADSNGSAACCHPRQIRRNYTISRTEL